MMLQTDVLPYIPTEGVPLAVMRKRMALRADLYDELDALLEVMTQEGKVYFDSKGNLWKRSGS